ncbi:TPA: PIG-L family deacetylase [Stenotrophomonas maltophilia]|nr:PIG-L family deacetylase [Stenotrophomonas maltophilia]HDS1024804.1 PIG-L family deacetylase [Stenotrophomonas maltophilia]HDS1028848.1 PIG-L family deacetylase [Stenotrophomonas maltophilia]HDS1032970.1 PIG-L family deacetylase [Stenotrophomonas maltophilia]
MATDILAIGAHPDDIELGCGGSLAKLARSGARVHALVLSRGGRGCNDSTDRSDESHRALRRLGAVQVLQHDFPDTCFPACRNALIAAIEQACVAIDPLRVYTMCGQDHHQDHRTVHEASIIACRGVAQILCYESPSTLPQFAPQLFEDISAQLELKIQALREHTSQGDRHYMQESHLRCHAQFRGQQIGIGPCEGFVAHRMVL